MSHVNGKMNPIIRGVFDPQIILMLLKTTKSESGVQICTRVKTNEFKIGLLYLPDTYTHLEYMPQRCNIKIESQSKIRPKLYHMGGRLHIIVLNWLALGFYCHHTM